MKKKVAKITASLEGKEKIYQGWILDSQGNYFKNSWAYDLQALRKLFKRQGYEIHYCL